MKSTVIALALFFCVLIPDEVRGQRVPVRWQLATEPGEEGVVLKFEARIEAG